jgi:hypothetical protein
MTRCSCCGGRLGLGIVSIGVFRKALFCSSTCKRLYRTRWTAPLSSEQAGGRPIARADRAADRLMAGQAR